MSPTPLPKGWDEPCLLLSFSTKKPKLLCSSLLLCRYAFTKAGKMMQPVKDNFKCTSEGGGPRKREV